MVENPTLRAVANPRRVKKPLRGMEKTLEGLRKNSLREVLLQTLEGLKNFEGWKNPRRVKKKFSLRGLVANPRRVKKPLRGGEKPLRG